MSSPDSDPAAVRLAPRDLQRVLLGYLTSALALLCGLPVLLAGWFAASRCTGEGFRCLGWVVYAMLAAVLVAVVVLVRVTGTDYRRGAAPDAAATSASARRFGCREEISQYGAGSAGSARSTWTAVRT